MNHGTLPLRIIRAGTETSASTARTTPCPEVMPCADQGTVLAPTGRSGPEPQGIPPTFVDAVVFRVTSARFSALFARLRSFP